MPIKDEVVAIKKIREYARANPITMPKTVQEVMLMKPIGDDPNHWTTVRIGKRVYRVVLSYENQNIGLLRHLSVSEQSGKRLTPDDCRSILEWFGFKEDVSNLDRGQSDTQMWWWEAAHPAFNVVEQVEAHASFRDPRVVIESGVKDESGLL